MHAYVIISLIFISHLFDVTGPSELVNTILYVTDSIFLLYLYKSW